MQLPDSERSSLVKTSMTESLSPCVPNYKINPFPHMLDVLKHKEKETKEKIFDECNKYKTF